MSILVLHKLCSRKKENELSVRRSIEKFISTPISMMEAKSLFFAHFEKIQGYLSFKELLKYECQFYSSKSIFNDPY